ncbi:hypothetical protein [Desulforamulus hydrothermalis]|uniref:Lipoprotein n=1 Tax=Desulforamulus hydrothermalis Lam5 = DSM 18033 TaxID=1121428 RepID=K8EFE7_9FIRM|nr:hypothetical protein [Desulforamulus hydrothermalis]CCO07396.1 hypothetical protein DESHY_110340 [Desulforamulus hydrothermalis Lam5 = DSM 18033]SHH41216.1 hypothetical protein SAMN02745177_02462 [Desulforamulus hydrothermalis Lam5 = DSM 18033]
MTLLLRYVFILLLLSSLAGCHTATDKQSNEKLPVSEQAVIPSEKTDQNKPSTQGKTHEQAITDGRVIQSSPQAPDPETQQLYNQLDKELAEITKVLESLDSVDDQDMCKK